MNLQNCTFLGDYDDTYTLRLLDGTMLPLRVNMINENDLKKTVCEAAEEAGIVLRPHRVYLHIDEDNRMVYAVQDAPECSSFFNALTQTISFDSQQSVWDALDYFQMNEKMDLTQLTIRWAPDVKKQTISKESIDQALEGIGNACRHLEHLCLGILMSPHVVENFTSLQVLELIDMDVDELLSFFFLSSASWKQTRLHTLYLPTFNTRWHKPYPIELGYCLSEFVELCRVTVSIPWLYRVDNIAELTGLDKWLECGWEVEQVEEHGKCTCVRNRMNSNQF